MSLHILPRPLFGDAASIGGPIEFYYEKHRTLEKYLSQFSATFNVECDFEWARSFLTLHNMVAGTYGNYRAFVERLLLWSWIYKEKSISFVTRRDFVEFISFNKNPPEHWVGDVARPRFFGSILGLVHNDSWRPINLTRSTSACKNFQSDTERFSNVNFLSEANMGQLIRVCSSFYRYLIAIDVTRENPAAAARDKILPASTPSNQAARDLTREQWVCVINVAESMANTDSKYERALFIVVSMFSFYLRGAELSGNVSWTPTMGAFVEYSGVWWFEIVDRNHQMAKISVRPDFIPYLIRYRKSRNLPPLPTRGEQTPLLTKLDGRPGLTDRQIRTVVQEVFDRARVKMIGDGFSEEECLSLHASVAWLRNTSAVFDAPIRNAIHLKQDLRYASILDAIDRYYPQSEDSVKERDHGVEINAKKIGKRSIGSENND
ncbi:site-specific integrase [Pseudomonas sp. P2757]|uniref:site-specific integrase n=1 Tax=unclassified Pseudomonas TaxID=196821 RepID=UPI003B58FA44